MIQQRLAPFAPLILFAFVAGGTAAWLVFSARPGRQPRAFARASLLCMLFTMLPGIAFIIWLVPVLFGDEHGVDGFARVLTCILLGLVAPVHATYGVVASVQPLWWQRVQALREAAKAEAQERARRLFDGPPAT